MSSTITKTVTGNLVPYFEVLQQAEAKRKVLEADVNKTVLTSKAAFRAMAASMQLITSSVSFYTSLTEETVDLSTVMLISSMISLQQGFATFTTAQAAMGNWAYLPLAAAIMSQIASIIGVIKRQQTASKALLNKQNIRMRGFT